MIATMQAMCIMSRTITAIGFAETFIGYLYFPIQNRPKMLPSRSSGVILPVISPR